MSKRPVVVRPWLPCLANFSLGQRLCSRCNAWHNVSNRCPILPVRLVVGPKFLVLVTEVRILAGHPVPLMFSVCSWQLLPVGVFMDLRSRILLGDIQWCIWIHDWRRADKKMRKLINHVVKEEAGGSQHQGS